MKDGLCRISLFSVKQKENFLCFVTLIPKNKRVTNPSWKAQISFGNRRVLLLVGETFDSRKKRAAS